MAQHHASTPAPIAVSAPGGRQPVTRLALGLALGLALALAALPLPAARVTVFAAASLSDALQAIAGDFEHRSGHRISFSFAATSLLARQIDAGAPADVFASASDQWMDYLQSRQQIVPSTRFSPISNRLVLVAPARDSEGDTLPSFPALPWLLQRLGSHGRMAVADVRHVPAGIYAAQALQHLGLWQALQPRLAFADNVRAALAFVQRGEAALGIVYASDARAGNGVRVVSAFPATSHAPIRYPFALLRGAANRPAAQAFLHHLRLPDSRRTFIAFGFQPAAP